MKSINERIVQCHPQENYRVWIKFYDGLEGVVDVSQFKEIPAFKRAWRTVEKFNLVRVDPETHTITWGEEGAEADINPAELRKWIENKPSDS